MSQPGAAERPLRAFPIVTRAWPGARSLRRARLCPLWIGAVIGGRCCSTRVRSRWSPTRRASPRSLPTRQPLQHRVRAHIWGATQGGVSREHAPRTGMAGGMRIAMGASCVALLVQWRHAERAIGMMPEIPVSRG